MLTGYGDCVAPGSYSLHSHFPKAVNYTCGDVLLSLVTEDIGNGPASVVFRELPAGDRDHCTVGEGTLRLGENAFVLPVERMYDSTLPALTADPAVLAKNLVHFSRIIKRESPPLSYAFLIDERRERFFVSSFERALLDRVRAGWKCFREGDVRSGARLLRGTGYGFTPSGDDFIAGYLSGLYLVQWFFHEDVAERRGALRSARGTGNPVSDSFIRHAMHGHFAERGKALLLALVRGGSSAVEETALKVLFLGETSGADFSTGLVCALKLCGY
jgi:hypothetical protein